MAQIRPSDIPEAALVQATSGELATLAHLKKGLPADYTVLHGVHWTNEWKTNTSFGEADFIILNRSGEILVIEQKDGTLIEGDGTLSKDYGDGPKSVGGQVTRCIDGIRKKFSRQHRNVGLEIDYLVYCPDYRVRSVNSVGLDPSRIVDATRATELVAIIRSLLSPGADCPDGARVRNFFQQTLRLVPDVHAHVAAGDKAMVRLWGGLAETVSCIEMVPLRLRVRGVPGCGKSTIAVHRFEQALREGKRPLLVCFNRPLAERLKAILGGQRGFVDTWHGLIVEFLKSRGMEIDFSRSNAPGFWSDLVEQAVGETVSDDWLFDTVIVDEGQDFEPEWFEILRLFARPDADILWLEDPNQALSNQPPIDLSTHGFIGFRAETNYRSPDRIARFLQAALPFPFTPGNTLPGLGVGVTQYDSPDQQGGDVARIVAELIQQGFRHSDIVVLSLRGMQSATFAKAERIGPFTVKRFTGEYDLFGNQLSTAGQILFESIYRFKGQQAPAVIVTDIDADEEKLELWQRRLLCAGTRATVRLELVMKRGNALAKTTLEASDGTR